MEVKVNSRKRSKKMKYVGCALIKGEGNVGRTFYKPRERKTDKN